MKKWKETFESWYEPLKEFITSEEFIKIGRQVNKERKQHIVIPGYQSDLLFKVFRVTDYNTLKVVIIGQDPYSNPLNAYDGLAFSNSNLINPQPSLRNILKEVENDIYNGLNLDSDINLNRWAKQGVLLINTAMTVRQFQPESHLHIWLPFTLTVINAINRKNDIIWLLWGNKAQRFERYINNKSHVIIKSGHPSPLNTTHPFIGCKCFSQTNKELKIRNKKEVIW